MLRDALARIAFEFRHIRRQPFSGHPLAEFIRSDAANAVRSVLSKDYSSLVVTGSPGKGNFAEIPWIAIFDPVVTTSATKGYYVVYLFSADGSRITLSLNQGTTAAIANFGSRYLDALRERSSAMKFRVTDIAGEISSRPINLAATGKLGLGYEAGHALGIDYDAGALPSDAQLDQDLRKIVSLYLALTYRGGLDAAVEPDLIATEFGRPFLENENDRIEYLDEVRRYKMHMRIERNPKASKLAKEFHGLNCQACDFNFGEKYGILGVGYVEAHHRRPLSSLEPDKPVRHDIAEDFVVLCANCHRMAHRLSDPSNIDELRRLIQDVALDSLGTL